jgi:hypothetical protein
MDRTFVLILECSQAPGFYRIEVLSGKSHLPGSPFSLRVSDPSAEPAQSGESSRASVGSGDGSTEKVGSLSPGELVLLGTMALVLLHVFFSASAHAQTYHCRGGTAVSSISSALKLSEALKYKAQCEYCDRPESFH